MIVSAGGGWGTGKRQISEAFPRSVTGPDLVSEVQIARGRRGKMQENAGKNPITVWVTQNSSVWRFVWEMLQTVRSDLIIRRLY